MKIKVCLFEILFIIHSYTANNSIQLPITFFLGSLDIDVTIAGQTKIRKLELNMVVDHLWIVRDEKLFPGNPTSKYINTSNITVYGEKIESELYETILILNDPNIKIEKIKAYHSSKPLVGSYDSFPLTNEFKDESFSVIHNLYNNHFIDKLGFGINIKGKETISGDFIIGSLPKDLLNKYPYYKSCKVNSFESKWGCNSTRIKLGDIDYINNDYSYFQTNVRDIKVPKKFHDYLKSYFTTMFPDNVNCSFSYNFQMFLFNCNCIHLNSSLNLEVFFEGFSIFIPQKTLTSDYMGKCYLKIGENKLNENQWIFGIPIFQDYLYFFDYLKNEILIYSDVPFDKSTDKTKLMLFLMKGIIIILFFSVLFLLFYEYGINCLLYKPIKK